MRTLITYILLITQLMLSGQLKIFDNKGNLKSLNDLVLAASVADVVCFGEQHDDSLTHLMQLELLKGLVTNSGKRVVLSMEMFETDVQYILDEYLNDLISEASFLSDSRPWPNYKKDYRPMVEFMKGKKLPIIAANAPRRYVRMVTKGGQIALNSLDKVSKLLLPKLPFTILKGRYKEKFEALMGGHGDGSSNIFQSQNLWDASMAHNINKALKNHKDGIIYHICGKFHVEESLGTIEHLQLLNKKVKICNVVGIKKSEADGMSQSDVNKLGDFIIVSVE
jgi:uncharacterized iron-regulated protein